MSLGFEQAGFDIAIGVDSDGHHVATHERNFPYGRAVCASVINLDGDKIRRLLPDGYSEIDVVVGGPPCQGFSHMGLRDLKDPRNSLIDHYVRLLLEIRPKAFVMENVPGLLAGETKKILDKLINTVEANGYRIAKPVRILDASEFGVPQKRRRVFVIGVRSDVADSIEYPIGPCKGQPSRPTVLEAISDLPEVEHFDHLFRSNDAPFHLEPKNKYALAARGFYLDPSDLSRPRKWNEEVCSGCLRTRHSEASVKLYAATPPGDTVPGHKLPRLDPNGLCPTLRAGSDSTHGSYTAPRPIHPIKPRCITAREAARLHGFPDWFALYPLKWHAYRQVGNAVCPPIARAIGTAILNTLGAKTTRKAPPAIELGETFLLPEDRPRTLKRIPILREYPPVVEYLFKRAYDSKRKKLRKASFSFADVKSAIKSTGVNLSWVREDTFLPEIARSRSLKRILAPVHSAGYSIAPAISGHAIGKFVPLGTPGTIEEKDTVQIRIDTIHDAIPVPRPHNQLNGDGNTAVEFLSNSRVQKAIWGTPRAKVTLQQSDAVGGMGSVFSIGIKKAKQSKQTTDTIVVCKPKTLPNKGRLTRLANQYKSKNVTILVRATDVHVVAIRFDHCRENPKELMRVAFELVDRG